MYRLGGVTVDLEETEEKRVLPVEGPMRAIRREVGLHPQAMKHVDRALCGAGLAT